jgi:peptidyl-prolyl cis-trans isomerase SurA
MYKMQLPQVKDEVTLAQIMMYPKLTEAHKQDLINRLKKSSRIFLAEKLLKARQEFIQKMKDLRQRRFI